VASSSLAVVGTGLLGASVALAAKRANGVRIAGWDPDEEALAAAVERGAVDAPAGALEDAVADAELVFVAAPVAELPEQVRTVLAAAGEEAIVTDVGSTKLGVCRAAAGDPRFIGGHPVCGSEARGAAHATADMFAGATWFLTPVATTDAGRYARLHAFVASLGALPVAIEPEAHDRVVALTSHLPHALANLLLNQTGTATIDGHDAVAAAGASLRDMTRVAGANPRIWIDIFLANREPLLAALGEHRRRIERLERALSSEDAGYLARWIAEAAGHRRRMLSEAHTDPGALQRLRVRVPDRPGVLAGVTQALGAARINIEELDLQHFSPERGGVLTITVAEADAARAGELLEAQGYSVVATPLLEE
jgi:prephenate dehydrogenase